MARKDVDLVIRAKDEAEKVVTSITKALNGFLDAQKGVQAESGDTEGSLNSLGAAIGDLQKSVKGLDIGNSLTKEMSKADGAVANLQTTISRTEGEVDRLGAAVTRSGAITAAYAAKLSGATAAQAKQTAAVTKAKAENTQLEASLKSATTAVDKLTARQALIPGLIDKQSASLAKASARYEDLAIEMAGTEKPGATLIKNFASSERAVASGAAKVAELRAEYQAISGELNAAGSAVAIFAAQSERSAATLAQQQTILTKITGNVSGLATISRSAAGEQDRLDASLTKATAALSRQSGELDQAEAKYVELAEAASKFKAATAQGVSLSQEGLSQQLAQQAAAANKAQAEFAELSGEADRLATRIGLVGVPTREMARQLAFASQRANEAHFAFMLQEESLQSLTGAFGGMKNEMSSVTSVQAAFIAAQEKLSASMKEIANDGFRERQAIRAVHSATATATGSTNAYRAATEKSSSATRTAAGETARLSAAYRKLHGDTRTTLSYTQRLRGEVLSLIAAYGGFYGVIQLLGGVVTAYTTLEAAQSRLGVAIGGDTQAQADEMDFLRRTANRLGVELGVLAQEYSKFAIATKGTNLEGENTRKIFLSVAEAARVNRSSNEEMAGVFTALTQIVSKGAVQMEELRQQLGDRLPGALSIMADGLGVTTAELIKMMENGEVAADALVPFADELDKRFGPGLSDALNGTAVALGRLKNAAFQALVNFGQGGFIESFTELANKLAEVLGSADFEAFMARASAATGVLVDVVAVLADNFGLVIAAGLAFFGIKLIPFIFAIGTAFNSARDNAIGAALGLSKFSSSADRASAATAKAALKVGVLSRAMGLLLSSTGIGLLITAVSVGIGLWAAKADEASEAMHAHQELVDKVRDAYDAVGGSVEEWGETLKDITASEAIANLARVEAAALDLQGTMDKLANGNDSFLTNFFGYNLSAGQEIFSVADDYKVAIGGIVDSFKAGELESDAFIDALDKANVSFSDGSEESIDYGEAVIKAAKALVAAQDAAEEAGDIVAATGDDAEEAAAAFDRLGNSAKAAAVDMGDVAAEKAIAFKAAMDELGESIESINRELEFMKASDAIDAIGRQAMNNVSSLEEFLAVLERMREAKDELGENYNNDIAGMAEGSTGVLASSSLIRSKEGFRETAYNDPRTDASGNQVGPNIYRAGYGSDTITLADESIVKITEGMRVSRADAERDLRRRITTEFMPAAREAATPERFDTFNPQQQAALTSIAYNYGSIPDRIVEALRTGSDEQIAAAIRGLGGDNGGINQERRNNEAAIFLASDPGDDQIAAGQAGDEKRAEEAKKAAEDAAKAAADAQESTDQRLSDGAFEIEQQRLKNAEKEREADIEAAIRAARADDPDISEAELATIREQVGLAYDLANAKELAAAGANKAKEAEEAVNNLLAQRQALEEQFDIAKETGNTELQEELRAKMAEINTELMAAIENAKALWATVGGAESDLAIEKLNAASASAAQFGLEGSKSFIEWEKVGELMVSGLTSAFDNFAKSVAEGTSIGEAARTAFLQFASDFLIKIGQMIVQQLILNALKAATAGTPLGGLLGFASGHTGGVVGSSRVGSGNTTRQVSPSVFTGAAKFHEGGVIGLRAGEVPIIAKEGEEMLTRDDPRHALNGGNAKGGGGGGESKRPMRIVNAIDGPSFLEAALGDSAGEEILVNKIRSSKEAIRAALEI
jgi:tape measure domain-containing protein